MSHIPNSTVEISWAQCLFSGQNYFPQPHSRFCFWITRVLRHEDLRISIVTNVFVFVGGFQSQGKERKVEPLYALSQCISAIISKQRWVLSVLFSRKACIKNVHLGFCSIDPFTYHLFPLHSKSSSSFKEVSANHSSLDVHWDERN